MATLRFVPTSAHGLLDYAMGMILMAVPWATGFAQGGAETWVMAGVGAAMVGGALFTDYEWGIVRMIPMPVHLMADLGAGVLLAVSPWLFGFADYILWPHVVAGLWGVGAALTTKTTPGISGPSIVPGRTPGTAH